MSDYNHNNNEEVLKAMFIALSVSALLWWIIYLLYNAL